jgi:ABC-2 type transport system ATP-binding protein
VSETHSQPRADGLGDGAAADALCAADAFAQASAGRRIVLAARGVQRRFGRRLALAPLDLQLGEGERVALIGPNGAGKTTLLSILAGVLEPSGGEVIRAAGRPPGWVPQRPALYSRLSVLENLRLFARLELLDDTEATVQRMLEQTGLRERAHEQVARLSGGNQQRLNIAVGLLARPAAVLLDEPSAALDPRQRERLWEFICALAGAGTAVLYSTHNVVEAERHAERVLVLVDGQLLFCGTPAQLREATGGDRRDDFEAAFVAFLRARGH